MSRQKRQLRVTISLNHMFGLGPKEIIIIAVVIVLLFGAKKIPELAKNLVQALKNLTGILKDNDKGGINNQDKK